MPESDNRPVCLACSHHRLNKKNGGHECALIKKGKKSCYIARSEKGICGPDGRLFSNGIKPSPEPQQTTPEPVTTE